MDSQEFAWSLLANNLFPTILRLLHPLNQAVHMRKIDMGTYWYNEQLFEEYDMVDWHKPRFGDWLLSFRCVL